jgi:opacity protein-like surface antigen
MKSKSKINRIVTALSAALLMMNVNSSYGINLDYNPIVHVGVEGSYANFDAKKESLKSIDGRTLADNFRVLGNKSTFKMGSFIGVRVNEVFGVEGGYHLYNKIKNDAQFHYNNPPYHDVYKQKLSTRHDNFYLDGIVYYNCYSFGENDVNLMFSSGIGFLRSKTKGTIKFISDGPAGHSEHSVSLHDSKMKMGWRVGAGVSYQFHDNGSVRLMANHQRGNAAIRYVNSIGVGLVGHFN